MRMFVPIIVIYKWSEQNVSWLCFMQVKVMFCPPEPVKIAVIREIYSGIKGENLSGLILILQSRIMSKARETIKEIFPFEVDTWRSGFVQSVGLLFTFLFSFCKEVRSSIESFGSC